MSEQELANLLISRGIFGPEEFNGSNLREILIRRGMIGSDENGTVEEIVRRRGII